MLFSRRKKAKELAERERRGETFWTSKVDDQVRTKVVFAFDDAAPERVQGDLYRVAHGMLLRAHGVGRLTKGAMSPYSDLRAYLGTCPDDMFPDVVEAMATVLESAAGYGYEIRSPLARFTGMVNRVFMEHRVAYELIGVEMVPFESRELHVNVVAPTISLLAGRPDLVAVETAYQDALAELSNGKPSDAITDAGTALQCLLVALGCEGDALGSLIASAKKKGLVSPHDAKLLDWVSADRSQLGDSHHVTDATPDDAWLSVHVVGALALRLTSPQRRGQQR